MRNVFSLSHILGEKGIDVIQALGGEDALRILNEKATIHLVLTDLMMPGMDGYELIQQIRKDTRFQNLPIIVLTAKAMKDDREKSSKRVPMHTSPNPWIRNAF